MRVSPAQVTAQVAALPTMDRDRLLALWAATLGGAPPRSMSQPFLRRGLGLGAAGARPGGLSAPVRRKLDALAAAPASGKASRTATTATPKLKAGGRLLREWAGVTHVVDVVEGGYLWQGTRHRSLSAIAQAITGAHWSGPRFFGLKEAAKGGAAGAKAGAAAHTRAGSDTSTQESRSAPGAARPARSARRAA